MEKLTVTSLRVSFETRSHCLRSPCLQNVAALALRVIRSQPFQRLRAQEHRGWWRRVREEERREAHPFGVTANGLAKDRLRQALDFLKGNAQHLIGGAKLAEFDIQLSVV
jgi:hypothetical protein